MIHVTQVSKFSLPRMQIQMHLVWVLICVSGIRGEYRNVWAFQFSLSVMSDSLGPMDCSTPGFPVHLHLWELTQTPVHRVGDAIQPSHPLTSPSSSAIDLSQHQVFSYESVLNIRWPKYWSFSFSIRPSSEYSGLISFRMDWLDLRAAQGTLKSVLQHHS